MVPLISNLDLKEVNIVGTYDSAPGPQCRRGLNHDVSVQGREVKDTFHMAGLVVVAVLLKSLTAPLLELSWSNDKQGKEYNVGGLVANLKGGNPLISQSRADVTILSRR